MTGLLGDRAGDVCDVGNDFCDFCDASRVPKASETMWEGGGNLKTLSETMGEGAGATGTENDGGDS